MKKIIIFMLSLAIVLSLGFSAYAVSYNAVDRADISLLSVDGIPDELLSEMLEDMYGDIVSDGTGNYNYSMSGEDGSFSEQQSKFYDEYSKQVSELDEQYGEMSSLFHDIAAKRVVIAELIVICLSLTLAVVAVALMIRKMSNVARKTNATGYVKQGSLNIVSSSEVLVRTSVSKTSKSQSAGAAGRHKGR